MGDSGSEPAETELSNLLDHLGKMRKHIVRVSEGLTEEQLRWSGVTSGTNLLGLLNHLTGVEAHWFRRVFLGETEVPGYGAPNLRIPNDRSRADVVCAYRAACARSDEIATANPDLSTPAAIAVEDEPVSLRSILARMIEETARHAGHADIIREQLDGATDL